MIQFRVLGSVDLRGQEGETLLSLLAQPKRVALLAYLAVAIPHGFHRREKLLGLFWPERDQEHARGALRNALYFLRRCLGEGVLASRGDEEVGLAEGAMWCDAVAFEKALAAGELEKGVSLYTGPLLDGFQVSDADEFERWLAAERQRLTELFAEALQSLAERAEGAKEHEAAAACWKRVVATDPFNSRYVLRLMEALVRAGDPANALQHAREHERLLREELGVEPDAELVALVERLRREPQRHGEATQETIRRPPVEEPITPATVAEKRQRLPTWRTAGLAFIAVVALALGITVVWRTLPRQGRQAARDRPTVAVLPLVNLSGLKEDEYFTDGIHHEILTQLTKIGALSVKGRTSVLQYRDSPKNLRQIGEELNARYLLEGGVFRAAGTVRINVQLIDAAEDEHVWAEAYDRPLSAENLLAVQSEVALKVAEALRATLTVDEVQRIEAKPTDNLEAYDYYLRGKEYSGRSGRVQDRWTAAEMYENAIELDPDFPQAWAALATTRLGLYLYHFQSGELAKARAALDEAERRGPDLPETHVALGWYHYTRREWEQALEQFDKVWKREPSNAEALGRIALVERRQGRWEESIANLERALDLDPRNAGWAEELGESHMWVGLYPEAEHYCRRSISLAPDSPLGYQTLALVYLAWNGSTERARQVLEEAFRRRIDLDELLLRTYSVWHFYPVLSVFGQEYAQSLDRVSLGAPWLDSAYYYLAKADVRSRLGQSERARTYYDSARVVLEGRLDRPTGQYGPHGALGRAYAGLGRVEDAIREGQKAVELLPIEVDAFVGPDAIADLARTYVMVGEYDKAIDKLDLLLSNPSIFSVPLLRFDPTWDPLRDHPRFQALLERYE